MGGNPFRPDEESIGDQHGDECKGEAEIVERRC